MDTLFLAELKEGDIIGQLRILKYLGKGSGGHKKYKVECIYCKDQKELTGSYIKDRQKFNCKCNIDHNNELRSSIHKKEIGNIYGRLKIIDYDGVNGSRTLYTCQCLKCGEVIHDLPLLNIKKFQRTKKCKCTDMNQRSFEDLTGQVIGNIKVLELLPSLNNRRQYKVQCLKCGKIDIKTSDIVRRGKFKCNCQQNKQEELRRSYIGMNFGDLTVVDFAYRQNSRDYYFCKCSKGHGSYYSKDSLNNNIKCSKCVKEEKENKQQNIKYPTIKEGDTFGNLKVLYLTRKVNNKKYYMCKCNKCNRNIELRTDQIRIGKTTKCDCPRNIHIDNLVGKKFGYLEVVEYTGLQNGRSMWKCFCTKCNKNYITTNRDSLTKRTNPKIMCQECRNQIISPNVKKFVNVGDTFGRVTVIEEDSNNINITRYLDKKWKVKCNLCGTEYFTTTKMLHKSIIGCKKCYKVKDLRGQQFDRLTVLDLYEIKDGKAKWRCECNCKKDNKNIIYVSTKELLAGSTRSCGCIIVENNKSRAKHNMYNTPQYMIWRDMKDRCNNPNNKYYYRYGGRGIKVCPEWDNPDGFIQFYEDFGKFYVPGLTIDRIDNNKGYNKDNCRWVTLAFQQQNKSDNTPIKYNNTQYSCIQTLLDDLDFPETDQRKYSRFIANRINNGWSEKEAITIPPLETGYTKDKWYKMHDLDHENQLPIKPLRRLITFDNFNDNNDK